MKTIFLPVRIKYTLYTAVAVLSMFLFSLDANSQTNTITVTLTDASVATTSAGATDQEIIRIAVLNGNGGGQGTCTFTQMNFTKALDAANVNVDGAKLYYTGTSSTFATGTQLGATDTDIDNGITFAFSQGMAKGSTYYYWLAYDISASAPDCDEFDASQVVGDITSDAGTTNYNDNASGSRLLAGPGCWNYCTSNASTTSYSYISNVTFNTINQTSAGCSDYWDYTAVSTIVTLGSSHNLTITKLNDCTGSTAYTGRFAAWIDWNNDGDFADAGEQVLSDASATDGPVMASVTVPGGATVGTTRMRCIFREGTTAPPYCGSYTSWGETQDFSVQIISPVNCAGTPNAGTISPATSSITTAQSVLLSWSELPEIGFTYQWQSGPTATGPWTSIGGATSSTYTASGLPAGATYFQLIVTCTNSGLSNTSASAEVNVTIVYCDPGALACITGGPTNYHTISNVTYGTINNNSSGTACGADAYTDYTGSVAAASFEIGTSSNLSITNSGTLAPYSAGVWIDFNQNGSFLDPGEYYSIGQGTIAAGATTTIPVLIPTTALTGTTRMRIQFAYGNAVLSSWTCFTNAVAGETEDYLVTLYCGATPSDITGRFPADALPLPCGSAATLTWDDHTCATGFKVYMDTNPAPTTLVANSTATSYYSGNLLSNTVYYWKIVPYSGGGDGASSTWSFTTQTAINVAISQDTSGCTDNGLCLTASAGAFPDYYWYDVPVGGTPLDTGTVYCPAGVTVPTTYYVSNVLLGPPASINASTTDNVVCLGPAPSELSDGMMFDVKAKSANVTITSLDLFFEANDLNPSGGTSNRTVKVYYRIDSYANGTNSATGWIQTDNLSVPVVNTPSAVTSIDITDIFIPAGNIYGIYVVYNAAVQTGANIYSNTDIEVSTGGVACDGEFNGVFNDMSFRGTVYYNISCSSPTVPVLATPWVSSSEVKIALSTVISAQEQCIESGWTYYADPAVPLDWLFAIDHTTNTFTAEVDIVESPSVYQNINVAAQSGSFLISRYWNVRVTSGSVVAPVDVRFFFDTAEVRAAYDLRNSERTNNYPTTTDVAWRWFKSTGVDFDPAVGISGNNFTFANFTPTSTNTLSLLGATYTGFVNGVAYVEFTGVPSFSGGTGGYGFHPVPGTILPINLVSFNAEADEGNVNLTWVTETEINNHYFTVERSEDGKTFEMVGVVEGAGNSNSVLDYTLVDKNPHGGISYYRLKQTDYNGEFTYSDVIAVDLKTGFDDLTVFPNPVTNTGYLSFTSGRGGNFDVTIYDVTGRKVVFKNYSIVKGLNNLKLPTEDLNPGMYFLYLGDKEQNNMKFIKE